MADAIVSRLADFFWTKDEPHELPILQKCCIRIELRHGDLFEWEKRAPFLSIKRRLDIREKTTGKQYETSSSANWLLLFYLSQGTLLKTSYDTADVAEEIEREFPGLFIILHTQPNDTLKHPAVLLQYKPQFMKIHERRFMATLWGLVRNRQHDGLNAVPEGNVAAFWGGKTPWNDQVTRTRKFASIPQDICAWSKDSPALIAVAFDKEGVLSCRDLKSADDCTPCIACREVFAIDDMTTTSGETLCCQDCLSKVVWACDACADGFHISGMLDLPCSSKYCGPCLNQCFEIGLQSRSAFPPKCCNRPIRIDQFRSYLSDFNIKRYGELLRLTTTDKGLRCGNKKCARTIEDFMVEHEWGLCTDCAAFTCVRCHSFIDEHKHVAVYSEDRECPESAADKALKTLAETESWRACPKCKHMISKDGGCKHVKCRCGHDFCFFCGETFTSSTSCRCEMFPHAEDDNGEIFVNLIEHQLVFSVCEHGPTEQTPLEEAFCMRCVIQRPQARMLWCHACHSHVCIDCAELPRMLEQREREHHRALLDAVYNLVTREARLVRDIWDDEEDEEDEE